jgi:adenylate cyclase
MNGQNIRRMTIQAAILASVLSVLVFTSSAIIYYNYRQTIHYFLNDLDHDIENVMRYVTDTTINYLMPAKLMTQFTARLAKNKLTILDEPAQIVDRSREMLDLYPQIFGFLNVDHMGNFIMIVRVNPNKPGPDDPPAGLPKNAAFEVRTIDRGGTTALELRVFIDKDGRTVASYERRGEGEFFDPRVRPWYTGAYATKKQYWSNPYVYAFYNIVGFTASYPILDPSGDVRIVMSADIVMQDMASLLKGFIIGKGGKVFIFTDGGQLLGHPDLRHLSVKDKDGNTQVATISDTNDPILNSVYQEFKKNNSPRMEVEVGDKTYIARISPFGKEFGKNWFLGFVAPKEDFTASMVKITRIMMIFSLLVFIIATAIVYMIARRIAGAIEYVGTELENISNLDIQETPPLHTRLEEIAMMDMALAKMKRSLRDFSRFVPKSVVKHLLESGSGAQLGGRKMIITTLFTDIKNFTTISEQMSSERLTLHLSEYFDQMTKIIIEHGGTVDKYIGDAIMAFWGAPLEDPDHPLHACQTAMRCQALLQDLNKNWGLDGKPQFFTRMGIHTGEAVVGNMGSQDRMNYSAFGNSINMASRLEGLNKHYGTSVLITHDTYKLTRHALICRTLDIVEVVGKSEATRIYEVMGMKDEKVTSSYDQEMFQEIATLSESAFKLYLAKDFLNAKKGYEAIFNLNPDDPYVRIMIGRCEAFHANPPEASWRGVFVMHEK